MQNQNLESPFEQLGGVDMWRNNVDLVIIGFDASPAACYCTFSRLKIVDPPCNTKYKHQHILVPHSILMVHSIGVQSSDSSRCHAGRRAMIWHVTCLEEKKSHEPWYGMDVFAPALVRVQVDHGDSDF